MADRSLIEWTDTTWQIVTGCAVVSPGCTNCYAMKLAGGRLRHHPSRAGLTVASKAGPVWNGQVRFNAEWLTQPLRWTRPRMIFVAAHGDLFHEGVTDDQLDQIFAVMALAHWHVFQILTKRPERMRAYLAARMDVELNWLAAVRRIGFPIKNKAPALAASHPLPNVWLGVSVEDQARADERIPVLLDTPAAVRWISAEPLLGPVDLFGVRDGRTNWNVLTGAGQDYGSAFNGGHFPDAERRIDWVVAGGESGPGARPMHPTWARQLRDQCAAAGVPFLFKQWGAWFPASAWEPYANAPPQRAIDHWGAPVPDDVTPETVNGHRMTLLGKKAAGRLLDGVLHDAFPEAR